MSHRGRFLTPSNVGSGSKVVVKQLLSRQEFWKAKSIRLRVFVREQGIPKELELDEDDRVAVHFLAQIQGRGVGTARVVIRAGGAKIGRMAVLKNYRGRGIGKELLKRAILLARRRRVGRIFLHAQVPVVGFYGKMGFHCVGRVFKEAGIPHRKMVWRADDGRRHQT